MDYFCNPVSLTATTVCPTAHGVLIDWSAFPSQILFACLDRRGAGLETANFLPGGCPV
jgi:hypothetical protein